MRMLRLVAALALLASPAIAQTGTVTNHAFAVGKGPGVTGFTSLLCTSAQLAVGQAAADPICQTITGDVTISAGGVTAIGASKVLNAQLATMAANTTKCNATAGTANPTDCTAATMRTNLALVPGTNVEAWDADLDALAALAGTGIARRTASNTWSVGTAVSNAELATMTTNTIKGNATSGSAVPTDLAVPSCSAASSALTWTTNTGFGCNTISGGAGATVLTPGGRLTPSSGVCVPTTDVAAATSIFYAPCSNPYVLINNGAGVQAYNFTSGVTDTVGLTLTLGANWAANTLYDVFVTVNGGNPVLCTVAWTSSGAGTSARATALSAYAGMMTNGALATCRISNAATVSMAQNQGTYVGTFITNGSAGQVDFKFGSLAAGGGAAIAGIWNMYNRTPGAFTVMDSTTTFGVGTFTSQWNPLDLGGTGSGLNNRVSFVTGLGDDPFDATLIIGIQPSVASTPSLLSMGVNSTSAQNSKCSAAFNNPGASVSSGAVSQMTAACKTYGLPGFNYIQALYYSNSGSIAFFTNGGGPWAEGLHVTWWW